MLHKQIKFSIWSWFFSNYLFRYKSVRFSKDLLCTQVYILGLQRDKDRQDLVITTTLRIESITQITAKTVEGLFLHALRIAAVLTTFGVSLNAESVQTVAVGRMRSWPVAAFLLVESNTVSGCEKLPPHTISHHSILFLKYMSITLKYGIREPFIDLK